MWGIFTQERGNARAWSYDPVSSPAEAYGTFLRLQLTLKKYHCLFLWAQFLFRNPPKGKWGPHICLWWVFCFVLVTITFLSLPETPHKGNVPNKGTSRPHGIMWSIQEKHLMLIGWLYFCKGGGLFSTMTRTTHDRLPSLLKRAAWKEFSLWPRQLLYTDQDIESR